MMAIALEDMVVVVLEVTRVVGEGGSGLSAAEVMWVCGPIAAEANATTIMI